MEKKSIVKPILANVKEYKVSSLITPVCMLGEVIVENFIPFFAAFIIDSIKEKDMDAIINASSSMKDTINYVGDKYGLPVGWINDDFMRTDSYTPRISRFSRYYHTYSNVVTIRTVSGEYLVAMKLKAGREYKYDRSDVIGILWEQEKSGDPLSLERIKQAVCDLYDSYDVLSDDVKQFVERAIENGNYEEMYTRIRQAESENKEILLEYQEEKPGVINNDNADDIIAVLRRRKGQQL